MMNRQVLNIPDDHIPNKDKGLIVTEAFCGYPMWASQRGSGVEPQPPPPRSPSPPSRSLLGRLVDFVKRHGKQLSPVRRRRLMEELAEIGLPKPAKLATGSIAILFNLGLSKCSFRITRLDSIHFLQSLQPAPRSRRG